MKIIVLAIVVVGCSGARTGEVTLRTRVESERPFGFTMAAAERGGLGDIVGAAPTYVSEFSCLGVNVVGPGIPSQISEAGESLLSGLLSGSSCTYPGVTSPLMSNSANIDVSLSVPMGKDRLVQIAGIILPVGTACSGSHVHTDLSAEYFEIGRARLDLLGNSEVNISNSYKDLSYEGRAAKKMNCGTGSGNFDATTIGTLLGWYMGGTAKNSGMSPTSGSSIDSLNDASGNNRHFLQASSSSQPTYWFDTTVTTKHLNNSAILEFSAASSQAMETSGFTGSVSTRGISVFALLKPTSFTISAKPVFSFGSNASTPALNYVKGEFVLSTGNFIGYGPGNHASDPTTSINATTTTAATASTWNLISLISSFQPTEATISVRLNRGGDASSTYSMGLTTAPTFNKAIVGSHFGSSYYFPGYIAEILIYSEALSTIKRNAVECYLVHKYGLESTIPGC